MKKVYAERLPNVPHIPLLYPNFGVPEIATAIFLKDALKHITDPIVEVTEDPRQADVIVLAHNYTAMQTRMAFVRKQADLAKELGKPFIVFWHGDSDAPVAADNALVFRTSQYRDSLRPNEHIMPAYAQDLLSGELTLRDKHMGKPTVGFCGWAGYKNVKNRVGTLVRNTGIMLGSMCHSHTMARLKGITFRMRAVRLLRESKFIESNFIIRSSYSGSTSTIRGDAKTARAEYVSNMLNSDYALVVKGDGNYSYRLYEALSLGRIPVMIDTETVLPLEDEIDYDAFMLRVSYDQMHTLDTVIADHFASLSAQQFVHMQQDARKVFETKLNTEAFLRHIADRYFV